MGANIASVRRVAVEVGIGVPGLLAFVLPIVDACTNFQLLPGTFDSGQASLCVLGAVAMCLAVMSRAVSRIDGIDEKVAALVEGRSRAGNLRESGLVTAHPVLPAELFKEYVGAARSEVTILQTWIPDFAEHFREPVRAALTRGVPVRILLLLPNSPVVGLRERSLGESEQHKVKLEVRINLEVLSSLWLDLDGPARARLQVRMYDTLPSVAVYRADDHYLVSSFLHGKKAVMCTQSEVRGDDTLIGREVRNEFEAIWGNPVLSEPVDFPDGWQHRIA
ncbi:hypothetical protein ACFY00_25880 [Kitasatospora sp. NPDC001540]|uniref:hypothetical protein n=1 Tax=Kitasatospora sp. NPDC001540 TaxID=3364014 RepID=UPI003698F9AE